MPRIYFSNDSYPELREIESRWEQSKTWWRAFRSAFFDLRLWVFALVQILQWTAWWLIHRQLLGTLDLSTLQIQVVGGACLTLAIIVHALLTVTWGGDLMRPHLRRVSLIAREACPSCGYQLTSQLLGTKHLIDCPECGESIPRESFAEPFPIPRPYRAWRGFVLRSARAKVIDPDS